MSKFFDLTKTRKKLETKKIFMTILLIATIIYIIYAIYLTIKIPTDTIRVESGVLTAEESAIGYIIRDETIVKGKNYKNGIFQILSEKEKAAKNQIIFRYYGKNEEEIQKKIEETNKKIQTALEKEKDFFPTDIKNLENQIDEKIQDLKVIKDVKQLSDYKKQISEILLKKATIAGENSKSGSYIKKLTQKREEYENKLAKGSEYIKSPRSGVVSYRVDGLENVLKPTNFEKLTQKDLEKIDAKTGKIISTSDEAAKVINNFECYIATFLNSTAAKQAEVGKNVLITLSSGNEVNATIEYIKKQEDDKYLIVFKVKTLTDELISYRKISINITWWSVSGIKIPNEAILEDDTGKKYVQKKTSSGNIKCYIKVLKTNDRYSIIGSYTDEDLKAIGMDADTYKKIDVYDNIMLYPKK